MHELSIALSVVEQVEEEAARHEGAVKTVYLKVGILSGVDCQALRFAYEMACAGTSLAGSMLEIESVPVLICCPACEEQYTPRPQELFCPRCITPAPTILRGTELEVTALELEP
jgi:hydrogenase nickel incorporation protein HypA/HybF